MPAARIPAIGIDVREACRSQRTGKGQWTYGCVSELLKGPHTFVLCTDSVLPSEWRKLVEQEPHRISVFHPPVTGLRWHIRVAHALRTREMSVDVYFSPVSYLVPALLCGRIPCVPVVHDLIAFRDEPHDRRATLIERLTLGAAMRHAASVCVVSEATRRDLQDKFSSLAKKSIAVVYAGPTFAITHEKSEREKVILCIGTLCPRKNQLRLIEGFLSLPHSRRGGWKLVLVGKRGWNDDEIVRLAGTDETVAWKNYLSDAECGARLASASVFAFPSLYEGFGMPVLDALCAGTPVLTSRNGSLAEVAGHAAAYCDPLDTDSIAKQLERLMTDSGERARLAEEGFRQAQAFSWQKTANACVEAVLRADRCDALL